MERDDRTTATSELTADAVHAALHEIPYPNLNRDLVSLRMVDHVSVCAGRVKVRLTLRTADPSVPAQLEQRITDALRARGAIAAEMHVPYLGEIPFDGRIIDEGDAGVPAMVARPLSLTGAAFERVARAVAAALGWRHVDAECGR